MLYHEQHATATKNASTSFIAGAPVKNIVSYGWQAFDNHITKQTKEYIEGTSAITKTDWVTSTLEKICEKYIFCKTFSEHCRTIWPPNKLTLREKVILHPSAIPQSVKNAWP